MDALEGVFHPYFCFNTQLTNPTQPTSRDSSRVDAPGGATERGGWSAGSLGVKQTAIVPLYVFFCGKNVLYVYYIYMYLYTFIYIVKFVYNTICFLYKDVSFVEKILN